MSHSSEQLAPLILRVLGGGVVTGLAAVALTVAVGPSASARAPANQACLGQDIRGYAEAGRDFGSFVSGLAEGGAADEIQAHLAGEVPDDAVDNSCND